MALHSEAEIFQEIENSMTRCEPQELVNRFNIVAKYPLALKQETNMGKIRRARQKLHQSSVRSIDNNVQRDEAVLAKEEESIGKSPMLKSPEEFAAIPDNLFAGIDINFDSLKKKLTEDDRVSVKSIAKSCKYDSKGKLLTKKEKQKIKHDLWMRKINTVHQLKKEALQKHKKRKVIVRGNDKQFQLDTLIEPVPLDLQISKTQNESTESKTEPIKKVERPKLKPVKKAKARQKKMLQEISAFRQLIHDPKIMKNPFAVITECVEERIVKELKKK